MAVARVHVRSWQAAYRNILPDNYLDQLRPQDRASKYDFATRDPLKPQTILAVDEGIESAIHGFATTMPVTDSDMPGCGELCALYVDPQHWGAGAGRALLAAARAHMFQQGFQRAILWVLTGNMRAERFYQRDGWAADGVRRKATVWDIEVDEIRYTRPLEPLSIAAQIANNPVDQPMDRLQTCLGFRAGLPDRASTRNTADLCQALAPTKINEILPAAGNEKVRVLHLIR